MQKGEMRETNVKGVRHKTNMRFVLVVELGKRQCARLCVDGMIILKYILRRKLGRAHVLFMWLTARLYNVMLLCKWRRTLAFHKIRNS